MPRAALDARLRTQRGLNLLVLALYALFVVVLARYHEPWRDEADAWLMARDASPLDVIRIAGHSGTPCLWYFAQMPFAKAGFGFGAQAVLNVAIMVGAAAVLLFRSPLPWIVRVPLLFGYYFAFEYSVVARNYGLGILFLFLLAARDRGRVESPVVYGALLGALANVSAHFFFIAMVLSGLWLVDLTRARASFRGTARRNVVIGLALAASLGIFALYQLIPRPDGQFPQDLVMTFVPRRLLGPVRALFPQGVPGLLRPLAVAAWGALVVFLLTRPRALSFLLASSAALLYVFVFKYVGGDRHYGLLLVVLIVALWLAANERDAPVPFFRPLIGVNAGERWERVGVALLVACLAITSGFSFLRVFPREIREEYSEAESMARFIERASLGGDTIVAHPANACSAVLPHLTQREFFYPGILERGSHMRWDARYVRGAGLTMVEVVARARAAVPEFDRGRALLLTNTELAEPLRREFELVHKTPGKPWRVPDESFFLYRPKPKEAG